MKPRLLTLALSVTCGTTGCALDAGSSWGELDPSLVVGFDPVFESGPRLDSALDYQLELRRLLLAFERVSLQTDTGVIVQTLRPALVDLLDEPQTVPKLGCSNDCELERNDDMRVDSIDVASGFVLFDLTAFDTSGAQRLGTSGVDFTGSLPLDAVISAPVSWSGKIGRHRRQGVAVGVDVTVGAELFDAVNFGSYLPVPFDPGSVVDLSFVEPLPALVGERLSATSALQSDFSRFDP